MNIKKFLSLILAVFIIIETLPTEAIGRTAQATSGIIRGVFKRILNSKKIPRKTSSRTKSGKVVSKFIHMAGKRCSKTGILYNIHGYPIFDRVSVCNLKLSSKIAAVQDRNLHFKVATRALRKGLVQGKIDASKFNAEQLEAIKNGKTKIPGYTWHHHQKFGKMQLVPEQIHKRTRHDGGFFVWYK